MLRRLPVHLALMVVLGLALLSAALVMAEDSVPSSRTAAQDDGMPAADGAALLDYILMQNPYTTWGSWTPDRWSDFGGYLESGAPHGATVRIFVNDVAVEAAESEDFSGTLPYGTIVVKENFGGTVDEPGDVAALTVMYKVEGYNPAGGDWFWLKTPGDGSAIDAEGMVEGCIGCHSQEGNADYQLRYAFGEQPAAFYGMALPEADGAAIMDFLMNESPYTGWSSWATSDANPEDYSGYLASAAPHGNTVRIFVNDRALTAVEREDFSGHLPPGTIVVKENYGGTVDEPGDLAALTIMYRVHGYNSEGGDWYWLKTSADGMTIDAEGQVEGCISCHGQEGNSDWLLRYQVPNYGMMDEMMGDDMGGDEMGGDTMGASLDGNALIDERCTSCHTRERIDSASKDRGGWEATVDRMIGYGTTLTADEREAVISFLAGG